MPTDLVSATPWGVIALLFGYFINRLKKVESRTDALETTIRAEQAKSAQLRVLLERVCSGYEAVRRELLKVARILRKGGTVSMEHLDEIDATADINHLLTGLGVKF